MENSNIFTSEELKALHAKSLELGIYFRDFCIKHNLRFNLCGGCCIGALRHKGFIPWDDDIDVQMPREDYDKLEELWNKYADTSRYSYQINTLAHPTMNIFATIHDNNTTFIKKYQQNCDMNHGICIDILPLDGAPDGKFARTMQLVWTMIYSLYCVGKAPDNHGLLVKSAGSIALFLVPSRRLRMKIYKFAEKKMKKYPVKECNYVSDLCSGPYYMKMKFPREAFDEYLWVDFENEKFPIPKGYDQYLSTAFGDYMSLPPEDKRIPHHDVVLMDLTKGYKNYEK